MDMHLLSDAELKVSHCDVEVVLSDKAKDALIEYGREVGYAMQRANPDAADCWTSVEITIATNEMDPYFMWGGSEGQIEDESIYVEFGLTPDTNPLT